MPIEYLWSYEVRRWATYSSGVNRDLLHQVILYLWTIPIYFATLSAYYSGTVDGLLFCWRSAIWRSSQHTGNKLISQDISSKFCFSDLKYSWWHEKCQIIPTTADMIEFEWMNERMKYPLLLSNPKPIIFPHLALSITKFPITKVSILLAIVCPSFLTEKISVSKFSSAKLL